MGQKWGIIPIYISPERIDLETYTRCQNVALEKLLGADPDWGSLSIIVFL